MSWSWSWCRAGVALTVLVLLGTVLSACRSELESARDGELALGPVVRSAPLKLVVLGSSTSAGTGPRDARDAYLTRYRAYLAKRFPDALLLNLAVGGHTTYHVQATGFTPPAQRPAPDPKHNITAALAAAPHALIVNLPSNDTDARFTLEEQLSNFGRLARLAADAQVALWVTTTQPRNFAAPEQIELQRRVRAALLQAYAPRALDFWTPFASADGTLMREFDSGDGVHLNAAAHTRLLRLMIAAEIPETLLRRAPAP